MSDEQNVEAGSETSGETAEAETSQEAAAETETTDASTEQSESTDGAGGAAEQTEESGSETVVAPDAELSRTGYADKGLHPGDECVCPDGRKGTVHSFDAGLICIPNHDQG